MPLINDPRPGTRVQEGVSEANPSPVRMVRPQTTWQELIGEIQRMDYPTYLVTWWSGKVIDHRTAEGAETVLDIRTERVSMGRGGVVEKERNSPNEPLDVDITAYLKETQGRGHIRVDGVLIDGGIVSSRG